MMYPNVFITAREQGKVVYHWAGHNVWTDHGRSYLAQLLALSSLDPDVPIITSSRIKHLQFGVGGVQQGVLPSDVATAYPAGFDPNATAGNQYDHTYPISPPISTLERPVRISGGSNPYGSAAPTDVWLTPPAPPKFLVTYPTQTSVSFRFFISGSDGDIVYAPFTSVPVSEAGLVLSGDANTHTPYNLVVAYVDFQPLSITASMEAEIEWIVGS